MHRIDTPTAQKDKYGVGKNGFTKGDPQTGTPATEIDETILDAVQEEICAVIEGSGTALSKDDKSQLLKAINKLIDRKTKYGCPLIGERIDWPHQLMPHEIFPDIGMEFIPYIGQPFDKVRFPLLAKLHPSGVLPADMRGEGVRGWDNNRGVDPGRALMSLQLDSIQNFTGSISGRPLSTDAAGAISSSSGVFKYTRNGGSSGASPVLTGQGVNALDLVTLDLASQARVSNETRGRSVAWNMITRSS